MDILQGLRDEKAKLVNRLKAVENAIQALSGNPGRGKSRKSLAWRRALSKAQVAAWARRKKEQKSKEKP